MESLFDSITQESLSYGWLEIIAVITAVIYVVLAAKTNRWCFLFGLISSAIYIYIATGLKFYFDSAINLYYVIMSFYGWFAWAKKKQEKELTVLQMQNKAFLITILGGFILTFSLAYIVDNISDASLPYIDAFTTVFAIIATWMVVKKYIQNWIIWIVVDIVAATMYLYKELYLTAGLFLLYTIISIVGYRQWKTQVR